MLFSKLSQKQRLQFARQNKRAHYDIEILQHRLSASSSILRKIFTNDLEELKNVPINSASKNEETLFDAPLSS
jgi:hypothetical protein